MWRPSEPPVAKVENELGLQLGAFYTLNLFTVACAVGAHSLQAESGQTNALSVSAVADMPRAEFPTSLHRPAMLV